MSHSSVLLVVEDDPNDVLFVRRGLAKAGVEGSVREARDGEEAVAYLEGKGDFRDRSKHPLPSLVLLDLKLPKKSGLEVLEWLRGRPDLRTIPVVVLTSSRESRDMARARDLGVAAYHVKPVEFGEFMGVVESIGRNWLARTKPDRAG
jgi:CheY-like chemotaxis protein